MDADAHVRMVLFVPKPLYGALKRAAEAAGEPMADALRARLASSLTLPMTAARSGCAGDGEAARAVSPELSP